MKNKIVLITGATSGIGKQTAISLAKMGATVVISGRSKVSAEAAVAEIKTVTNNSNVDFLLADISTNKGIVELVTQFERKFSQLDVLINNAGSAAIERKLNNEDVEINFATNVLAPYQLTTQLMRVLQKSESPRVITLMGGDLPKKLDLDNLQAEKSFDGLSYYSQTKLSMMAMMYEYAERLKGQKITVNVCYPGQASTNMTQSVTADMLPGMMKMIFPLFKFFVRPDGGKSAEKASRSSVYLASSTDVEGKTQLYFDKNVKLTSWPEAVTSKNNRNVIWELVSKLSV
jgi:NAD(P)-dependent dehydrogenase (short-subunit alcohol dehydrogenase family)